MAEKVFYLDGTLPGCPCCRWALVVGYYGFEECLGFITSPTPKQIRRAKRTLSNWVKPRTF